ncbi:MAG: hypothetical protein ACLQBA_07830 [Candidatus Binataceae bacterium]|jgi:hypothetical protein
MALEELLRAYFLRSGFFVIRGVPFAYDGEDLTDLDLVLYERPTGATRRIQVVDIKYKQKPKAVERMFWTRGLVEAVDIDGGYVATTDSRPVLRKIADKLDLGIIDGADIKRIRESPNVLFPGRITDEELVEALQKVDKNRKDKILQSCRKEILASLSSGFGASAVVRALGSFSEMASLTVSAHPGSTSAEGAGRLAYLSAAIACACLDYVSVDAAFRSIDERRELLLKAVRFGSDEGARTLRVAVGLIEKYAKGGSATARQVESALLADLNAIPAEIIADQAGRLLKENSLFTVARELEAASYERACPAFDQLSTQAKAMVGAFLDYAAVKREAFAVAWSSAQKNGAETPVVSPAQPPAAEVQKGDDQERTMNLFS